MFKITQVFLTFPTIQLLAEDVMYVSQGENPMYVGYN